MWFFLNYEEMFRDVLLEYEVEETVGWQTFCVKKMDLNVMLTFQDVVGKAVSEYYVKTEMRGAVCQAEAFEKFGCVFFIAYPQDYYESEPSYVQGKLDKRQPIQTAFKVFFMYNPELGRLSVKVRGGGLKKFDLASAFSVAVFGSKITEEDTIYYNLNVLKDFSFPFLVPPNDHVEAVKVMSLTIAYPRTEKKRLILSSHNSTGQGLLDMKLWIGELGLDRYLSTMDFVQAKIRVKFSSSVLKIPKAKGTVTVTVSKDSCPLGVVKELDRKVAGYLKDWGIDVSAYSNHAE